MQENQIVRLEPTARLIRTKGRKQETEADYDVAFQKKVLDPLQTRLDSQLQVSLGTVVANQNLADIHVKKDRYIGESAIANFMNDAIVSRSKHWPTGAVDFAAFNSTGIRGVDQKGSLTYQEWYNVMPYADQILVFELTGSQIKDIIEDNARRIVRPEELIENGGSLNPDDFISRGFQHYSSGIRYDIYLGKDVSETRAENITLNGRPVATVADQTFRMVFNSYVSDGRESFDGSPIKGLPENIKGYNLKQLGKRVAKNTYLLYRSQIIDYILNDAKGVVGPKTGARYDGRVTVR